MRIQTYKVLVHDGINIYVRRLGTTFEYLFSKEGNIYTQTVKMRPSVWRNLLSFIGFAKKYNDAQLLGIVRHMQALAIQRLSDIKNKKHK